MENDKISSLLASRDALRDRLYKIIRNNPPDSLKELSSEMRINLMTLKRFLDGESSPSFISMVKIQKYVDDNEDLPEELVASIHPDILRKVYKASGGEKLHTFFEQGVEDPRFKEEEDADKDK
jgi:hypothetical protein